MVILGIDPGTACTGYGILKVNRNIEVVDYGCIYTSSDKEMPERLKTIYQRTSSLIEQYHPNEVAVEQIYFSKNAKTALSVGQARGVIILAASMAGVKASDYTPLEIKQAIVGYGRATKKQIKYMLKIILNVNDDFFPKKDDAWDAMAVCLCHANYYKFKEKVEAFK